MSKIEELLVDKGLYDSVDISIDDFEELESLIVGEYNIDCFCVECNEKRVFHNCEKVSKQRVYAEPAGLNYLATYNKYVNRRYNLSFVCSKDPKHIIYFIIYVTESKIIKIGQLPSIADISKGEIKKYKSALSNNFKEYSTALGLFSHGVGIGSFVYVRRIIENLVFNKYQEVKGELQLSEQDFIHSEFKDKIEILKKYLPSVLVTNRNIYGIVSKGIHELSEEECLSMFPLIKTGIELILDDIIAEKERIAKASLFTKFVADKTGELKQR